MLRTLVTDRLVPVCFGNRGCFRLTLVPEIATVHRCSPDLGEGKKISKKRVRSQTSRAGCGMRS